MRAKSDLIPPISFPPIPIIDVMPFVTTPTTPLTAPLMVPIAVIIFPITIRTGPTAAAIPAMVRISFCVPSSRLPNQLITSVTFSTIAVNAGIRCSDICVNRTFTADFSRSNAPAALSCMIEAISSVVPAELLIASVSLSKSSGAALIMASIPDMASFPNSIAAAEAWVASSSPPIFSRSSPMTSAKDSIFPSASVREIPYLSMTIAIFSVGDAILVIADRRDVPA